MGLFLYTFLFPGGEEEKCRAALQYEAGDMDLNIHPEECHWHVFPKGPAVQLNDGAVGFDSAGRLSDALDTPVMGLYIYDDDLWGYDLWQKGRQLDQFASVHGYFDEDSPPNTPGNASVIARHFDVEPERIERYLIPWEDEDIGNYAYHNDEFTAGDSWQMADFMAALGFDYDQLCPPEPEPVPVKEPNQSFPAPTRTGWTFLPPGALLKDTPELPNALTSQDYAFQRAEMLGEDGPALMPLLQYAKYQDAISLLTEAIQKRPEEAGFLLVRAFCWSQLERQSGRSRKMETDRDLTKSLELEPDNIMALRARCPNTATTARYARHIQDLTRLMELDPENRDLYQVSRAYRHHWLKDDVSARADLDEVLFRGQFRTVDFVYLCRELRMPGF